VDVSVGWLLRERQAETIVFDTGGDELVELGQLAQYVLELMDRVGMDIQRPGLGDGSGETDDTYVGDGRVFRSMADQQGVALAALR